MKIKKQLTANEILTKYISHYKPFNLESYVMEIEALKAVKYALKQVKNNG